MICSKIEVGSVNFNGFEDDDLCRRSWDWEWEWKALVDDDVGKDKDDELDDEDNLSAILDEPEWATGGVGNLDFDLKLVCLEWVESSLDLLSKKSFWLSPCLACIIFFWRKVKAKSSILLLIFLDCFLEASFTTWLEIESFFCFKLILELRSRTEVDEIEAFFSSNDWGRVGAGLWAGIGRELLDEVFLSLKSKVLRGVSFREDEFWWAGGGIPEIVLEDFEELCEETWLEPAKVFVSKNESALSLLIASRSRSDRKFPSCILNKGERKDGFIKLGLVKALDNCFLIEACSNCWESKLRNLTKLKRKNQSKQF